MGRSLLKKLRPYYVRKAFRYLRHYGPKDFLIRVRERLAPEDVPYGPWYEAHKAGAESLAAMRDEYLAAYSGPGAGRSPDSPLFSVVVPAYNTPEIYLRQLLDSVLDQAFGDLELVIANASCLNEAMGRVLDEYSGRDSRLVVVPLDRNLGIAGNTNAAIEASHGRYICFMDHDDLIAPDALYEAWKLIRSNDVDLIYTDEDKIRDDGSGDLEHFQPHFKPGFNLDLLRSNNYICHFLMVRRSLIESAGGLREDFDGAQDYEFILRLIDQTPYDRIARIPKVLYHWRTHESSTADNPDSKQYAYESGRRALEEHLARQALPGEISQTKDHGFYRIRYPVQGRPKVSIIIPNRESRHMLERCIDSIEAHTQYGNYEVIVVENQSSSGDILDYYRTLRDAGRARVVRWKAKGSSPAFNFSAINNYGVRLSDGDYLVFMNNDIEVRDGWLEELVGVCSRPDVGVAGARLFFPDGRIQSAGIVVGIGGIAGSLFTGMNGSFSGYMHKASIMQDLSAVTAALMIVKRGAFLQAGGFDEDLAVAFNDVDLCLKLRRAGWLTVYDPFACAVHHESASRGDEYTKDKAERYRREAALMKQKWPEYYEQGDPYYNPNLSLERWDYALKP